MDNYKTRSFNRKPTENKTDKQLFSFDVCSTGAKNFLFDTYENIYSIIKKTQSNFYEDNTFSDGIKLFVDIDDQIMFNTELERDKYADNLLNTIIQSINNKLFNIFNITNPSIIILISDTLVKVSLHIIYPDIIFSNIYEMKYFMNDIKIIDQSVYKIGCFRMLYCSKINKNNCLISYKEYNYDKSNNDYIFFLDCCICYNINKQKIIMKIPEINKIVTNINIIVRTNSINIKREYMYHKVDFNKIKQSCGLLNNFYDDYNKWLLVAFTIKDLYLSVDKQYKKVCYKIFDDFSKKSSNYNKIQNKNIFLSLEPKIDINYLFRMAGMKYYILPFYNYQEIIFNPKIHKNIVIVNEKYISINITKLLNYNYIFLKSPTGTGKTTLLKNIIDTINIKKILSITSRVNLAGEHMKALDLSFYLDLRVDDFKYCDNLVIQLESLRKCNYKLFKNGIVILDEVNSLLSHLRSPTLNNKRKEIYMYLIELIKNAKYVICLDADLSDWNIKFLEEIKQMNYIVYYNTIQNKLNNIATFYKCPQSVIDIMENQIKNKIYFIACFDSLKQMNKVIEYLSKFGNKKEWLIYSSEINYNLIDTKEWNDKYIFFTPTIIYGVDYNYKDVDVFCFVYKNHLNPLQIYQMISRARKQRTVHIYCNEKVNYIKYKSIDDVIYETDLYEKNFGSLVPLFDNYIDIDDKPYRTMYYNYKFMDSILKTNIKAYLEDMMQKRGYDIKYNNIIKCNNIDNKIIITKNIKDRIINLLSLNPNDLSPFDKELVSDDRILEKHFNLRILLNNNIEDKLVESIGSNLFIETIKNKYTKIKICKELMVILDIHDINNLLKDITKNFNNTINNTINNNWLNDNIEIIKNTFNIRTKKYNNLTYYNIYILLITILKNLFDIKLFIKKQIQINNVKYIYYIINNIILNNHKTIITKLSNYINFID
jgi:hypothetical protein